MRLAVLFCLLILVLSSLFLTNCGKDDDPADPIEEEVACSISVTSPDLGRVFESSDEVNIRWTTTGSQTKVLIELYKDALLAGVITPETPNDGFYTWVGSTMGLDAGDDFNIMVTTLEDSDCRGLSPTFCFNSTEGCELAIIDDELGSLNAGFNYNITWSSFHGSGLVDIYLVNWEGIIGIIAEKAPNVGSYTWLVDSFNFGTDYAFYQFRIEDCGVAGCEDESGTFGIDDPDICWIDINQPDHLAEWTLGEIEFILYNVDDGVEFIDIKLYTGTVYLGTIVSNWPVGGGFYEWEVTNFGNEGADDFYRVRIENADDPYCHEESPAFSIF